MLPSEFHRILRFGTARICSIPDHFGISNHAREFSSEKDCEDYVDRIVRVWPNTLRYCREDAAEGQQPGVGGRGWSALVSAVENNNYPSSLGLAHQPRVFCTRLI